MYKRGCSEMLQPQFNEVNNTYLMTGLIEPLSQLLDFKSDFGGRLIDNVSFCILWVTYWYIV